MLAAVALLAVLMPARVQAAPSDYEGLRIARIVFDPALQPYPDDELLEMLPVKTGEALRLSDVRASIERLYATGRYQDLAADVELVDGALLLRFITRGTWFVGRVSVEGVPEPPNRGQLVNATKLQLGGLFTEQMADTAAKNISETLRKNGFYEARVDRILDYDPSISQVNVVYLVEPGPRARFARPEVIGTDPATAQKLLHATRWRTFWGILGWRSLTESRLQRGLDRARRFFQERHHLLSRVSLDELLYDPAKRRVTPFLNVEPGPRVRVRARGARVSGGKLRQLVPIYQEQSADRDLLMEGAGNLTEHFQAQGYFDAKVDFRSVDEADGSRTIEYTIDRGPRYKMVHLEISGNQYFDTATLRERMYVTPATRVRFRHGRYSEILLERDVDAIVELYRSNGFSDVRVETSTEPDYRGKEREVAVFLRVQEGPQKLVGSLAVEGVSLEHLQFVTSLLASLEGQPYSESNLVTDRNNVLNYYYNNGYPFTSLLWQVETGDSPGLVDLALTVQEGPRQYVRGVLVGGLKDSDPEMVTNRIRLEPGEALSQSQMVESQRQLYDLGVFARVDMAVQNPEGLEKRKYLLHQFEEARRYSVNAGVGAEIARIGSGDHSFDAPAGSPGFSPRVSLGVSRANMFGIGHTLGVQTRISDIQRRTLVTYLAPQFKGREDFTLSFTALHDFSRDIRTFESRRLEGTAQVEQKLSRANAMQYRFSYRRVSIDENTLKISRELIPVFAQSVRVGALSLTFIQDRRDDPLESHRGVYNTVDFGLASKAFTSETDYFRLLARNSSYHPFGKGMVLARTVTFGWLHNLDREGGTNEIPLSERFFSGGASSHRSFPENQAGPRDLSTGFPVGGRALLMNSLELRFPLRGDHVGGVLFHDGGNVYSRFRSISGRVFQRNREDFDYAVHAFGLGIRYKTPVGPLRLDLAYAPNAPRFFGFQGTQQDLLEGRGTKTNQRISPLQFHFSIGQTF